MPATALNLEPFYRSAVLALRALEAAGARRPSFGPEPDARWGAFRGELREADRLDLVLRNAAVTTPAAFAPRVVLALPGLSDDEPFGPDWPSAGHALAHALVQEAGQALKDGSPMAVLEGVAKAWALQPRLPDPAQTATIAPQTRVIAAGAGAILALARHFQGGRGLDLAEQVVLVTASPGERQLLGIAAALLGSAGVPGLFAPGATADTVRAAGFSRADLAVISDDADPAASDSARALARELGA